MLAIIPRADRGEVDFPKCIRNRVEVDLQKIKKGHCFSSIPSSSGIVNQKSSSVARSEIH